MWSLQMFNNSKLIICLYAHIQVSSNKLNSKCDRTWELMDYKLQLELLDYILDQ